MKKYIAIPTIHPEYQLYQKGNIAYCSSLQVAQELGKRHDHVLEDIARIAKKGLPKPGESSDTDNQVHLARLEAITDFFRENFIRTTYINSQNKKQPMYLITQEGLNVLIKTYNSEEALYFTILYSKRFKAYEAFIREYILSKDEFPPFTQAIADTYGDSNPWHYKNEIDMIYRIVLGMDAKHFREVHNIRQGESIRPYLTDAQYKAVRKLQAEDIRMLYRGIEYQDRKSKLSEYVLRSLPA